MHFIWHSILWIRVGKTTVLKVTSEEESKDYVFKIIIGLITGFDFFTWSSFLKYICA